MEGEAHGDGVRDDNEGEGVGMPAAAAASLAATERRWRMVRRIVTSKAELSVACVARTGTHSQAHPCVSCRAAVAAPRRHARAPMRQSPCLPAVRTSSTIGISSGG